MSDNQWSQLDKSVRTAIDNHSNLVKYYIAIPIDRPDGKGHGKSMLQKWRDHIADWKEYASVKKMKVSFEYWGKYELEIRLIRNENEGMLYYFFNLAEFTDDWFNTKNQDSIDALGSRYTPELNFKLPFLGFLDGFDRDVSFQDQINSHYEDVLEKHNIANLKVKRAELKKLTLTLDKTIKELRNTYGVITLAGVAKIPFESLRQNLDSVVDCISTISKKLYEWRDQEEKAKEIKEEKVDYYLLPYNNELHELRELMSSIKNFHYFLDSEVCGLANSPYLILTGRKGFGKSHLLADFVEERKRTGKTSLLLLGENFSTNEMPWTQLLKNQLRFEGNEDIFLGALNAKAESKQNRIIIIIDALNEGNGRQVWPKKLKSFIRSFHRYPWLGLIVSIRDTFKDLIAPESDVDISVASQISHPGFEGVEYEASTHFFKYYSIFPPSSPLLHPEFQSPLFLKLFCEGLAKRGLNRVPTGYQGITAIIEYYLDSIEHKLSQPDQLDYDINLKLVRKAVDNILAKMVEGKKDHLPYVTGEELISKIFFNKCRSDDKQYLKRLISEGVINEDLYWEGSKSYSGIHFAYQRFQDQLIVSTLLDKNLDRNDPEKSFISGTLHDLLKDEKTAYYNQNIIEALSIQLPERIGKELHEVAPYASNYSSIATAFIDSLVWRRVDTIGESSRNYVNQVLVKKEHLFFQFLNVSISLAIKSDFYFNADWFHKVLFDNTLAERDAWWTIWLHDKYGENSGFNSVKRLIDWAWNETSKEEINNEEARLAAVMLGWFLTSSNRYLRDAATKALVCLLHDRISVLIKVLQQFEKVNDPYVFERLYAVAYGCALRTNDHQFLVELSEYIYEAIFKKDEVYPHILLRDYARGVIEYTIHLDLNPKIEIGKVRPPYISVLPDELPTIEAIDVKYNPKDDEAQYGRVNWGTTAILRSMTTEYGRKTAGWYGDFGRYVFQRALRKWKVDFNGLSNYAIERIFELGYDPKIFSTFDSRQGSGRGSGHKERIGKKYQWIVFYEILARVADNCQLLDESISRGNKEIFTVYEGPWNPYVRDIDPSIIIKVSCRENGLDNTKELPWWITIQYQNWQGDEGLWKRNSKDFPPLEKLLRVKDKDGTEWLNLSMHPDWMEPRKIGEDRWNVKGKRIWYDIGSWLVKPKDLSRMQKVENTENGWSNWFPQISDRYEVYSREFHWSPSSLFFQSKPYFGGDGLPVEITDWNSQEIIAKSYHTSIYFLWEEEFDCSKEEAIAYHKPSVIVSQGLRPAIQEGQYINDQDEIICFDPSVYERGPSCLLVRKDYMQKIIKQSGLQLVWIICGEKQILGNDHKETSMFDNNIGGFFHMGSNGVIKGQLISYVQDYNKQMK